MPMPSTAVRVPVLKSFVYNGHRYAVGAWVILPPDVAAIYARQGLVSLTRRADLAADASTPNPVPRRGRYRRRDLRAEEA